MKILGFVDECGNRCLIDAGKVQSLISMGPVRTGINAGDRNFYVQSTIDEVALCLGWDTNVPLGTANNEGDGPRTGMGSVF